MVWGRGNWGTRGVWGGTSVVVKADEVLNVIIVLNKEQLIPIEFE